MGALRALPFFGFLMSALSLPLLLYLLPVWNKCAGYLGAPLAASCLAFAGLAVCGLTVGIRFGRRMCRSQVRWYLALPARSGEGYLASVRNYHRTMLINSRQFFVIIGLLSAAALWLFYNVSCRGPWGRQAVLSWIGLVSAICAVMSGLGIAVFRCGDWPRCCAQFMRRTTL